MGFFNKIVQKVEKQAQEQAVKPVVLSSKEEAARARKGSEELTDKLRSLQFADYTHTISEEKMEIFKAIVSGLAIHLEKAKAIALDTTGIDNALGRIVVLLQKAINEGYEKTAGDICKLLKDSVEKDRTEIAAATPAAKEYELEMRISVLEKQYTLFECRLQVNAIERGVQELDKKIIEDKKCYAQAQAVLKKMMDEHPDLVEDLKKFALVAPGHPNMGLLVLMNNAKQNVVDIYNAINRELSIKALKKERITELSNQISGIETMILKAANTINPEILANIKKFTQEYETSILQEEKENSEMRELSEDLDRVTEMVMTSEDMINRVIATDMAYRKILQQEQAREEGIRVARENQKKQENTHAPRHTNING